jgi:CubicO group peptidase (beta-lactamase class C family)
MSNLSAALNSLSSTTVVDFYMHWRPGADDRERMMISRSSTVVWALVLFAVAVYSVFAGGKGHVVEVGLSIASVAYGALLGVFLLGTLTRYATQGGAIVGMICGFGLNLLLWLDPNPIALGPVTIPHVAFTWYVLIGSIVTFVVGTVASFLLPRAKSREKATAQAVGLAIALAIPFLLATHCETQEPTSSTAQDRAASGEQYDFSSVTTLVNQAIAAKKLPGAVVLVNHDGKTVFEQAYGVRKYADEPDLDGKPSVAEPMTVDTIFDMASLTKCLATATAVMQLVEQGKVDVDAPVVKYLPEFGVNGKEKVTVRELLTHYSGLPEDVSLKDEWGLASPDKAEGIRRAMNAILYGPPGITFKYSDINFITLGAIVEKVSGETLDVYAERHIFGPIGMTHTRYLPIGKGCGTLPDSTGSYTHAGGHGIAPCNDNGWLLEDWMPNIAPTAYDDQGTEATNYYSYGRLLRGRVHDPTTRRMGGVAGHAGVFSTASDVALFAQALLDRLAGRRSNFPLKRETLKLMTQPEQPATAAGGATVFVQDGKTTTGIAVRGFGWTLIPRFRGLVGRCFRLEVLGIRDLLGPLYGWIRIAILLW